MKVMAIIQARIGSTRLPGKILKPVLSRPMLELQIERIRKCARIEEIVVATGMNAKNDAVVELCRKINVRCFRGSEEDLLDRFYKAVGKYGPEHIVRLTGDCPLCDPFLIDALVAFYFEEDCDYASNFYDPRLPHGLDAEIFSSSALTKAWKEACLPYHREHVTTYFYLSQVNFRIASYRHSVDLSDFRWTVDYPEDLKFVRTIYHALYPSNPEFAMEDILSLIKMHPELADINSNRKAQRDNKFKRRLMYDRKR